MVGSSNFFRDGIAVKEIFSQTFPHEIEVAVIALYLIDLTSFDAMLDGIEERINNTPIVPSAYMFQ